jgi:Outer membrane protein beta-barrel domain
MRSRLSFWLSFSLVGILFACRAGAQVVPAGRARNIPVSIGAGGAAFSPDFNKGVMAGVTFWGGYQAPILERLARGLSITGEIRDLDYLQSNSQATLREVTFAAGFRYEWQRFADIRPYGRAMGGYGRIHFPSTNTYVQDSSTIGAFSGGADMRLYHDAWMRVDYEYQVWPDLFSRNLHPQGVSVGVLYNFRSGRQDF